jgi:hypothetical protein
VRRFLIQPIFLILFIPAFYYQKLNKWFFFEATTKLKVCDYFKVTYHNTFLAFEDLNSLHE